ncbi:tetratricopeptide repeat protein [Shimia sp. MMG029]|uniref:tetratricopeptide repeat protein n=1 Tax=Shimia sp. MMG029 TaxID=3021978 RepID=UPI0022FE66DF|nr:tetratricopeptide repeat protein [Shimia sp. MMG029]MDA5557099.1 tetratricopeptide repeat protein [Shimia sp. MMG029]
MRHTVLGTLCFVSIAALAACSDTDQESVERAIQDVNAVDESNLSDVMLTVADPNEGISYFQRTLKDNPDRIDIQRGLAISYVRAKRYTEAVPAWSRVTKHKDSTATDLVDLADSQIRAGQWDAAEETLNSIPPTHETFKRYRLEAMIADSNQDWNRADSFYEIAVGLTTRPGGVMNNWGYSKLTRGDYAEAERLFGEAIRQDSTLFTAKNNMVLARGAQRKYTLPVIPMVQTERAQLLHTLALSAIKQGDTETSKVLLREAIETHPQHFEAAVRALNALENS